MLVISCPDWIAGDTVLHQREDRDYVCAYAVRMSVCVHASRFVSVCCRAKCKMIAKERREEIDVGAF